MCHTEQCKQFPRVIRTCTALVQKFVPRLLTPEEKEHRVAIGKELRQRAVGDPTFMSRVITGDESWVYGYDPETEQVFAMEEPRIPKKEEGEAEPQRDQEHANPVFRHSRECAPRICTRRPDRERRVPLQCSSPSEEGHSAKTTCTVLRGQLAAPWWQCTLSPSSRNAWVSRPQRHYHTSASTLFTRFGPLWLLLPEDKAAAKGSPLSQSGGDPAGIAECSWYTSKTRLPARVPAVAMALGSMCHYTRGLFWRGCCPNLNQVKYILVYRFSLGTFWYILVRQRKTENVRINMG